MNTAVARRIEQELGISAEFKYLFKFIYQAQFGDAGSEHELCSVFAATFDGELTTNKQEIAEYRWVGAASLDDEIKANPEQFTPWMKQEWQQICSDFRIWIGRET